MKNNHERPPLAPDETLRTIAEALGGISFGIRSLAGQSQSMGSVELLANAVRDGLSDVASAIRELAEVLSEANGHRVGKQAERSGRAGGVVLEDILTGGDNGQPRR